MPRRFRQAYERLSDSTLAQTGRQAGRMSFRLAPYWVGGALTALFSVLYAKLFVASEQFAFSWGASHPHFAWLLIPSGMVGSWLLVHFLAPGAAGSGIPQLIAALKVSTGGEAFLWRMLQPLILPVKLLGSCLCVALGGVSGREGPMLQISGSIFYGIHRLWPGPRSLVDLRSMILAGGAAGLAAAFNTPLGGIVFAVEELAKVHLSQVRTYIFHAVVIAGLLAKGLLGNYLYLERVHAGDAGPAVLLRVIPVALLIGFVGGLFAKALVEVLAWRARLPFSRKFLMTVGCGLLVAALFFWRGLPVMGSGRELIRELLAGSRSEVSISLAAVRILGNYFTYIGGVVGGIFAPSLASGAALGAWASTFLTGVDPQILVLVGMTAFLTGVTQTPFTSAILVLEMTDGHGAIFTLLLASVCAQGAAHLVDPVSFYEHISERFLNEAGLAPKGEEGRPG